MPGLTGKYVHSERGSRPITDYYQARMAALTKRGEWGHEIGAAVIRHVDGSEWVLSLCCANIAPREYDWYDCHGNPVGLRATTILGAVRALEDNYQHDTSVSEIDLQLVG